MACALILHSNQLAHLKRHPSTSLAADTPGADVLASDDDPEGVMLDNFPMSHSSCSGVNGGVLDSLMIAAARTMKQSKGITKDSNEREHGQTQHDSCQLN